LNLYSCPVFGSEFSKKMGSGSNLPVVVNFRSKSYRPLKKKPFDENVDENLSAAVHFQCRIFKCLTCKLQNN